MTGSELITKRLDGKIAVVTGGNSGIGLATAQRFVEEGAFVFITGRRQSALDTAVKQIGKNVTGVQGDVSNLEDLDRLGAITESNYDKTFSVNVKGLLFTVQKALPLFQEGGSIILNASTAGSKGVQGFGVYSATTAAIRSFARSWTTDLKQRKIRVNAISPGRIDTPGLNGLIQSQEQGEQLKQYLVSTVPLGRMGSPEEVAKAVSFLASDESSFVTGIELFVDGGQAQI
jgi:NAD(P)-dependent dehydrogenase (short-subunit alcohol dehydrogenase family)